MSDNSQTAASAASSVEPSAATGAGSGQTTVPPMSPPASPHSFFGHPRQLANIFGLEMWERFSFYGMQAILLLYLYFSAGQGGLGLPQSEAISIVGAYGGSVYLCTIIGAWVADRVLGAERTLYYSAILIMLGHVALSALPGASGVAVGLVLIAIGSGGLKANATSVVGTLYSPDDPKRDAGFSLFYLGINLGAFIGPLLTGWLQTSYGFHWGFGAAALGMFVGLTQYTFARRGMPEVSKKVPSPLGDRERRFVLAGAIVGFVVIVVLVSVGAIGIADLSFIVVAVALIASVAYFVVMVRSKAVTGDERSRVLAFIPLFFVNVSFWALYQQQFTVLTVLSDENLNRNLWGWEFPIAWVNSLNPIFVIVFSGVFAWIWTKWGSRQPPSPVKFGLGAVVMGIAFLLFIPFVATGLGQGPLLLLTFILFVFMVAELLISPIGLSLSTKLAPAAFRTQMVALYFLSVSLGTSLAGVLASFYTEQDQFAYFSILGAAAILVGLACLLGSRGILALMRGVR